MKLIGAGAVKLFIVLGKMKDRSVIAMIANNHHNDLSQVKEPTT